MTPIIAGESGFIGSIRGMADKKMRREGEGGGRKGAVVVLGVSCSLEKSHGSREGEAKGWPQLRQECR